MHELVRSHAIDFDYVQTGKLVFVSGQVPIKDGKFQFQGKLGAGLSLDDFGTGYSSLAYLKRFPIDCLKIDRSFVADVPRDGGNTAITQAIVAMAHSLGLRVVAEGVETNEQLAFLRDHGCDEVQGYYLSVPLPEPEASSLIRRSLAPAGSNVTPFRLVK